MGTLKTLIGSAGLFLCLSAGTSHAATLKIVNGLLVGASGVEVTNDQNQTELYDVDFVDGVCTEVFDGCFDGEFAFLEPRTAGRAARALEEQVFLNESALTFANRFDSSPELTFPGTGGSASLDIITPFRRSSPDEFDAVVFRNTNDEFITDEVFSGSFAINVSTNDFAFLSVFAIWSIPFETPSSNPPGNGGVDPLPPSGGPDVSVEVVPLPSGVLLLLSGLAGLGALNRRKQHAV